MLRSLTGLWRIGEIHQETTGALNQTFQTESGTESLEKGAAAAQLDSLAPRISIVIPALNEAKTLPQVLDGLPWGAGIEVLVVDGGSGDGTAAVAAAAGARVLTSRPGRSRQQNRGAAAARGEMLLFLHADTCLPTGFEQIIGHTLAQRGVVAGAFSLAIDGAGWGLRLVEWGVNRRSRWLQMPYGDQGLFLRAEVFRQMGGFPDLPIMEDFELVRRLRRRGRVAIAPAAVVTSDRRWRTLGVLRTTLANQVMIAGYLLGVEPQALATWYRRLSKPRR